MNALFGSLTTEGLEEVTDRVGGFQPLSSDIYTGPIKAMYAGQSPGGARNVTIIVDVGGREYRETIYVTNKNGENFFLNKNDKTKKVPLPGFTTINNICLATTGKPLSEQEAEDKIVKIYNPETRKEEPTTVPMLTAPLGETISLGILNQLVNKNEKDSNGKYVPTPETREENVIDAVFHTETKKTVFEAENGVEEAAFWDRWLEANKGKQRDRRELKDGEAGQAGRPGNSKEPPQGGAPKTSKSLFAKN